MLWTVSPPGSPTSPSSSPPEPWFEAVWTQVSLYKKLMMHLKEHCSYVTLSVERAEGLTLTGSSAIDHMCMRVHLPPTCFHALHVAWSAPTDRVELNMYTLYSIMKKATAYRHERVRFRVEWQPQGYYAVTVTFETVNKSERFHMRGARPTTALQLPRLAHHVPAVTLNPTLLADAFQRFDEESFRTVKLTVHAHCGHQGHPHTVAFVPVEDTLTLRGRTDSMRGTVYIPYWTETREGAESVPPTSEAPTKRRLGDFLLASLRSVTRFASLAQPKQLALRQVDLGDAGSSPRPLCVSFAVVDCGTVACYLPPVAADTTLWSCGHADDSSSSSSEDERLRARVRARTTARAADVMVDDRVS